MGAWNGVEREHAISTALPLFLLRLCPALQDRPAGGRELQKRTAGFTGAEAC